MVVEIFETVVDDCSWFLGGFRLFHVLVLTLKFR